MIRYFLTYIIDNLPTFATLNAFAYEKQITSVCSPVSGTS